MRLSDECLRIFCPYFSFSQYILIYTFFFKRKDKYGYDNGVWKSAKLLFKILGISVISLLDGFIDNFRLIYKIDFESIR